MIVGLIGCCFPSDKDKVIKCNDFNTCNDINNRTEIGKNSTISKFTSMFTVADSKANGQQLSTSVTKLNLNVNKGTKTILLDRLKLYNETLDPEVFKSRIGQCLTIKPANVQNNDKTASVSDSIYKLVRKHHLKYF